VHPVIAILTDFGLDDTYVGVMKSVILKIHPDVDLIDLTHAIPPGDVRRGAFELWRAASYLPPGAIILGVVDPGVGTERKAIALDFGEFKAVGPDNGLFSYLLFERELHAAVRLSSAEVRLANVSGTFHGRDVFAPAAAHLARGLQLSAFGPLLTRVAKLEPPELAETSDGSIRGEIIHRDHFGNLVTSIGRIVEEGRALRLADWTGRGLSRKLARSAGRLVLPDGTQLSLGHTFADVPVGELLAYTGSTGLLEIAANGGDASAVLGLNPGTIVRLSDGER
jgi:S-adenosylmethionine hydrolase